MSFLHSARTKGYIKVKEGENAGSIHMFQFNPESFAYSRSADWTETIAPGMSYPIVQWASGTSRSFGIDLFMWDKPHEGIIEKARDFILDLLPPEENDPEFTRPPVFTFVYGDFIKDCVLQTFNMTIEEYDTAGNITQAILSLTCLQIGG